MIASPRVAALALAAVLPLAALSAACGNTQHERAEAVFEPIRSRIAGVERLSESRTIDVYGIVQPARQTSVSSRVVGPVVSVAVDSGDTVAEGDVLLEIQPQLSEGQVAQARGALAQAEAARAMAEKNLARFENLHAKSAASDLELDMARMQFEQADGAVEQARGAVKSASSVADDAVVRAPFPARVVDRLVEVGDLAAPGRPLVRLESSTGRKIWLVVRESDIGRLVKGQVLPVRFDTRPELGAVSGTVDEIVPAADPMTHTFTVKLALRGVDVPSGSSGRAELPGDVVERLTVPAEAVHRRGGLELVVVRDEDGTARTRAITTGRKLEDGRVECLSGLTEQDQVVLDAPGPVADGTPVEILK